jgi:hypothetical protein
MAVTCAQVVRVSERAAARPAAAKSSRRPFGGPHARKAQPQRLCIAVWNLSNCCTQVERLTDLVAGHEQLLKARRVQVRQGQEVPDLRYAIAAVQGCEGELAGAAVLAADARRCGCARGWEPAAQRLGPPHCKRRPAGAIRRSLAYWESADSTMTPVSMRLERSGARLSLRRQSEPRHSVLPPSHRRQVVVPELQVFQGVLKAGCAQG